MSPLLPKTFRPRQGLRASDRFGPCKECGYPGAFRCFRCRNWRCRDCIKLRRGDRVGVYLATCFPRCRLRMKPEVAAIVRRATRGLP